MTKGQLKLTTQRLRMLIEIDFKDVTAIWVARLFQRNVVPDLSIDQEQNSYTFMESDCNPHYRVGLNINEDTHEFDIGFSWRNYARPDYSPNPLPGHGKCIRIRDLLLDADRSGWRRIAGNLDEQRNTVRFFERNTSSSKLPDRLSLIFSSENACLVSLGRSRTRLLLPL